MSTTLDRLAAILAREYKLAPQRLSADAALEGLGIDSLGTVELLWLIEEEFGIKLPADPVELSTLGDVVLFVDALVARPGLRSTPIEAAAAPAPALAAP